jgi:outer membrane receptor protein involved in Fe transport
MRTGPIGGEAQTPSRPPWSFFMGVWLADSFSGFNQELETQSPTTLSRSDARSRTERRDWMLIPRLSGRIGRDQVSLRGNISGSSTDGSYLQRLSDGSTVRSETSKTERDSWQLGGDWTRRLSVGRLETSWSGNRQSDELLRQRAAGTRYDEDRTESTWQLKSKLTGSRESLLWMTGIDYENRQAHGSSLDSAPGSVGLERLQSRIERLALWGQNEWELPAKTTLTLGLRGESVRLQSQVNTARSQQQLDFWQPSLHTRTPITETAQWRMNIARVTRQPSVWDLLDRAVPSQGDNSPTNPDQLGNPNLRPEVTQTFDIGVEQRLPGQGQAGLSLFMRRTGDVIATELFEQSGQWVSQRQNIGSAHTVGLEGDLKRPLAGSGWARDWMITANATVLQSRMSDGPREGTAIPGQPSYTLSLGAAKPMRRTGGTFGGLSASLNGPASLSTPTLSGRERARITLDAHVGHSVPRKGFWRVGVYNLGDAPVERSRSYREATASIHERSKTYYAPRIYASIGAQL